MVRKIQNGPQKTSNPSKSRMKPNRTKGKRARKGDARRKIQIKPLRERVWLTLKLTPKRDFCAVRVRAFFVHFLMHSPKPTSSGDEVEF